MALATCAGIVKEGDPDKGDGDTIVGERLSSLILSHLLAFPYTNQYLYCEGLKMSEQRMKYPLDNPQPTYCYQHNEFFIQTLLRNGWQEENISRKGTIVVNRFPEDLTESVESILSNTIMTHSIVILDRKYIIDVGFADNSLRDVLEFRGVEEEVHVGGDLYKFQRHDNFSNIHYPNAEWWSVSIQVEQDWLQLWRFPRDIDMDHSDINHLNHLLYFSTDVVNIRDRYFVTAKVTQDKRYRFSAMKAEPGIFTLKIIDSVNKSKIIEEVQSNDFAYVMHTHFGLSPLPSLIEHFNGNKEV